MCSCNIPRTYAATHTGAKIFFLIQAKAMEFHFEFPFSFIALVLIIFVFQSIKETTKSKVGQKLPPGPWKLPLIGSLHHLAGGLPHHSLTNLAKKYGPIMHLQLGQLPAVVISSPELAKEVLKTHDIAFASRGECLFAKIMFYDMADIVFATYGDYWRQMRKVAILYLLSTKSVKSFSSIREDEAFGLVSFVRSSLGQPINLTDRLLTFASSIISRTVFGKVGLADQDSLITIMKKGLSMAGGFDLADLYPSIVLVQVLNRMKPKLRKMHQKVDSVLDIIIAEHQKNLTSTKKGNGESGDEDLVDVLLKIKERVDLEFSLTMENIKAILFDMFAGGTENTSSTIEWAMALMIKNPRVMEKAQAELRDALKGKTRIEEKDIMGLKYLKWVIKETMRLQPAAPLLPRECLEQTSINGYNIPIKTKIIINVWALSRDPKYWHNADKFIPERFEDVSIDFKGNHLEYIPFGAGRRGCPGISYGLANAELGLAQLLYHFNWKLPNGVKPEDLDMTESSGLTASRRKKLYLIARPYNP